MSQALFRRVKLAVDDRLLGVSLPYGVDREVRDDAGQTPYVERFAAGAFARSLAERGSKVRLLTMNDTRSTVVGGPAAELRESDGELFAAFTVAASPEGDALLELIGAGAEGVIGFRPIRDTRDGDVLVRCEAALLDVRVVLAPQRVIARSVAQRRLQLLELHGRGGLW